MKKFLAVALLVCISPYPAMAQEEPPRGGIKQSLMMIDRDGRNLRVLLDMKDFPMVGSPEWSPSGKKIAVDAWVGSEFRACHVFVLNRTDKKLVRANAWGVAWSPKGNQIAYTYDDNLCVHDLTTGSQKSLLDTPYRMIYWNFGWSHDGTRESDSEGTCPSDRAIESAAAADDSDHAASDEGRTVVPHRRGEERRVHAPGGVLSFCEGARTTGTIGVAERLRK